MPSQKMGVTVSEIEDDEMLRAFTITSLAFQRNESVWDAMYPKHWTEEGRKIAAERWILTKKTNPHALFRKAVDEATGTIMGVALWFIYHPSIPEPQHKIEGEEADYEEDDDIPWCHAMVKEFDKWRQATVFITNGKLVDLELLAVDPEWQYKGAGHALVSYGAQKADEMGVTGVVGSTAGGRKVYEKNGYMDLTGPAIFQLPKEFEDRQAQHIRWMIRPKRGGE